MLNRNNIKLIRSLSQKKFRESNGLFIAEGEKIVYEAIKSSYTINTIFATDEWAGRNNPACDAFDVTLITEKELATISKLSTPNKVLATINIPKEIHEFPLDESQLTLVLDRIQDPGNFGTIVRTANWFGIKDIICSEECVDIYNPKVVQATMGAIFNVNINYTELAYFLKNLRENNNIRIYGAALDGKNVYSTALSAGGMLVLGNESKGISESISEHLTDKLLIPSQLLNTKGSESLNVSTAAAILCSEFRRRNQYNPQD